MWLAVNPQRYLGKPVGSGHCVDYVKITTGLPATSYWRKGQLVKGNDCPAHCAIATFGDAGIYENKTDGSSHAAIFISENDDGLIVYDQWVGQPVHQRTIHFRDSGDDVNNGNKFYIIECS